MRVIRYQLRDTDYIEGIISYQERYDVNTCTVSEYMIYGLHYTGYYTLTDF